jgi:hypothetical protein
MILGDPCGAEDRDSRPVDLLDGLEALVELARDPRDVFGEIAVPAVEDPAVVH